MNNSSKISNNLVFGEHISEASARILTQLNNFIYEQHYLFDYYKRHKHLEKLSFMQIIINSIKDFFWKNQFQKFLTFLIVVCFIVISSKSWINIFNDIIKLTTAIYLVSLYIQVIVFLLPYFKKGLNKIKNPKNSKYIIDLASYDISNHLEYASNIGNNNSIQEIELEEDRFKITMFDQARSKEIGDSFIPLLSIIYVLLLLWFLGNPQVITLGGVGIASFLTLLFSFLVKFSYKNLLINQHCLFILQKAIAIAKKREGQASKHDISLNDINQKYSFILKELQIILKETKANKKVSSINKNIKGKNLFKELKNIKITDAPRDLSTNFDSYINRGESAGTDIH